jgi:hypothetical protein
MKVRLWARVLGWTILCLPFQESIVAQTLTGTVSVQSQAGDPIGEGRSYIGSEGQWVGGAIDNDMNGIVDEVGVHLTTDVFHIEMRFRLPGGPGLVVGDYPNAISGVPGRPEVWVLLAEGGQTNKRSCIDTSGEFRISEIRTEVLLDARGQPTNLHRLHAFNATFLQRCGPSGRTPGLSGTVEVVGSGGNGGGGGGGGSPPPPPPPPPPPDVAITVPIGGLQSFNGESVTAVLEFGRTTTLFSSLLRLSAPDLPHGITAMFSPDEIAAPGDGTSVLTLDIGPEVFPRTYSIVILATAELENGVTRKFATAIPLRVHCDPPFLLSAASDQPQSQSIPADSRAVLNVRVAGGTGPFTYQWYRGPAGSTHFPVGGARHAEMTTPPINTPTEFWVRVSNACGSQDSRAALITPTGGAAAPAKPPSRRARPVNGG